MGGDGGVPGAGEAQGGGSKYPSSKLKLDELFLHWLSLPDTQRLVLTLLEDVKAGRPVQPPAALGSGGTSGGSQVPQVAGSQQGSATPAASQRGEGDASTSRKEGPEGGVGVAQKGAGHVGVPALSPLSPRGEGAAGAHAAVPPPLSPKGGGRRGGEGTNVRSPLRGMQSPRGLTPPSLHQAAGGEGGARGGAPASLIPRFFFPRGARPVVEELRQAEWATMDAALETGCGQLSLELFGKVAQELAGCPSFAVRGLYERLVGERKSVTAIPGAAGEAAQQATTLGGGLPFMPRERLLTWYTTEVSGFDATERLFNALRGDAGADVLVFDDFKPLLVELLAHHPGLVFLQETPEFQEKYALTVIYRIFYKVNRSDTGRITLREFRASDLEEVLAQVDAEEDINRVLRYFSYEHFYVIYCKFWELDTDHDFLIDKEDLLRYGNHALTYRIVERVFSQAGRRFRSGRGDKMGYEDFTWFILSEEDKSTPVALDYWFQCVDLDGDGVITPTEMEFFYDEQLHRMECISQEPVLFPDILCQMTDMINPRVPGSLTLQDLKKSKLSTSLFNVLFNLNKFIAFETRDPFLIKQEREQEGLTDWDRFARAEYIRLSMEEEVSDGGNTGGADMRLDDDDDDDERGALQGGFDAYGAEGDAPMDDASAF